MVWRGNRARANKKAPTENSARAEGKNKGSYARRETAVIRYAPAWPITSNPPMAVRMTAAITAAVKRTKPFKR